MFSFNISAMPVSTNANHDSAMPLANLFNQFLTHVENTPDKPAVIDQHTTLTYRDFATIVNQLAIHLQSNYADHLVAANEPIYIGIRCKSKLSTLIAEFAVLQVGATFVPFNCDDPVSREAFIQKKTHVSLILSDDDSQPDSKTHLTYCNITPCLKLPTTQQPTAVKEPLNDCAYILFTSGSTADNPKGVMRSRTGLLHQMTRDYKADLALTSEDCILNLATLTHDQGIVDCFAALLNGCTLCLYDIKNSSIENLHQFMQQHQVTVFSSIPSLFATIFASVKDKNTFPKLRVVTIGGEETLIEHAKLYQHTTPASCLLINGYGATELSWISSHIISHDTDLSQFKSIPLGKPTQAATIKLMPIDDDQQHQTNMAELCVSSDSLALGYLKDEQTTKEAFFTHEDGLTYYRTGDMVTLDQQNCLHFQGRKVWHEKIHGKRINLREIENTLKEKILSIKECIVLAFGEEDDKKLYAFYTEPLSDDCLMKARSSFGQYFREDFSPHLLYIETLPTLPNGKVNRQALREILKAKFTLSDDENIAIRKLKESTDAKVAIEGFWREALHIPVSLPVNTDDSFKSLGGSSLKAMQLCNKINQYFAETHQTQLSISFMALNADTSSFINFGNYILSSYNAKIKGKEALTKPWYVQTRNVDIAYTTNYWRLSLDPAYGDDIESNIKRVNITIYDYASMKIIIDHFNQLRNIQIYLHETEYKIFSVIADFIEGNILLSQVGLMFFVENNVSKHWIPAILCRDITRNKVALLFADSMSGTNLLKERFSILHNDNVFARVQRIFPQIEIYFDLTGRQVDNTSCYTDSLLYLIAALQRDMLRESTFLLSKTMQPNDSGENRYPYKINPYLSSWNQFISPIQTFYHSQASLIPFFIPEELTDEQRSVFNKLKDYEVQNKLTKKLVLVDCGEGFSSERYEKEFNTTTWDKSFEFAAIIEANYNKMLDANLACSSSLPVLTQNSYKFFKSKLNINRIIKLVILGDQLRAENLIQTFPELSIVKGEATDYSNRIMIGVTPLQAALCAYDQEMCIMLAKYMSDDEIIRQYNEIFPEGMQAHIASQTSFDFSILVDVISQSASHDAIDVCNMEENNSLLCRTLKQFRVDFSNRSQQEKIFNSQHLSKIVELFDEKHEQWNYFQTEIFWNQVVGYVQRFLPANIAQDFAYGLRDLSKNSNQMVRSFILRKDDDNRSMYPLNFNSQVGLGFDYAATTDGSSHRDKWITRKSKHSSSLLICKNYLSEKQLACQKFYESHVNAKQIINKAMT